MINAQCFSLWQGVCLPFLTLQACGEPQTFSGEGVCCCYRKGQLVLCVDARLIHVIFMKSLAVLSCLPWRIKCMALGFVSGLTEYKFSAIGQIHTPWWTAVVFTGKVLLMSWASVLWFRFLERSCIDTGASWIKDLASGAANGFNNWNMCRSCSKELFFSFSCSFLHSQPLEREGILQPLVSKGLGLFCAVQLPSLPYFSKQKILRGGWGS